MAETLRDQLSQALDNATSEEQTPSGAGADAPVASVATPASSEPEKPGRTAGRPRDDQGRLLPGKPQKDSAAEPGKPATPTPSEQTAAAPLAADPKPRPQRPTSWKKDHWEAFDKLAETNPALAEYINQREREFTTGVSTYKSEADKAKSYIEAVAPFQQTLQQYGIDPVHHIKSLFNAHQMLALGTPEQRLGMFVKLAQDYQVPLQSMFTRGQDGQIYFNAPQQQHQGITPQQVEAMVQQRTAQMFQQHASEQQVHSFLSAKDERGSLKHPHYETVRETMAQLLESRLADDLDSAYDAAIRLPQHSEIWDAMQRQQREADTQRQAEERRKTVQTARGNAVSPKSQPTTGTTGSAKPTGLRANIESAFDEITASRV